MLLLKLGFVLSDRVLMLLMTNRAKAWCTG
jgi:hypothetical protein